MAQQTERELRLQHEDARLRQLVGELTLDPPKATRRCGHEPAALARIQTLEGAHPFWGYRRI